MACSRCGSSPPFATTSPTRPHVAASCHGWTVHRWRLRPAFDTPSKFVNCQPRSCPMNHSMAVGTNYCKVGQSSGLTWLQFGNCNAMVAFGKTTTERPISILEFETADLAVESAQHLKDRGLLALTNRRVSFTNSMKPFAKPPLEDNVFVLAIEMQFRYRRNAIIPLTGESRYAMNRRHEETVVIELLACPANHFVPKKTIAARRPRCDGHVLLPRGRSGQRARRKSFCLIRRGQLALNNHRAWRARTRAA